MPVARIDGAELPRAGHRQIRGQRLTQVERIEGLQGADLPDYGLPRLHGCAPGIGDVLRHLQRSLPDRHGCAAGPGCGPGAIGMRCGNARTFMTNKASLFLGNLIVVPTVIQVLFFRRSCRFHVVIRLDREHLCVGLMIWGQNADWI